MIVETKVGSNDGGLPIPEGEACLAFPLAPGQAVMWPRVLTSAGDPRFNGAFRLKLAGKVDAGLLERSLRQVAKRHESLRATFRINQGEVQQVILPESGLQLVAIDLRGLPEDERDTQVEDLSSREARTGFDLTNGTPIRAKLLRLRDKEFILALTIHQIICDGWSIGILMEELAQNYSAFAKSQPQRMLPLDFQFSDYVAWQREFALDASVQLQFAYWKRQLAGCRPLRVSGDGEVANATTRGEIVSQLLSGEMADQLRGLNKAQSTTMFVTTLAACMLLLSRYAGETDIAIRTPFAGRSRVEVEGIIGQFVNQVVIRAEIAPDITVSDLIARVREAVWDAVANQDAPFDQVLRNLAGTHTPTDDLFPINFVCQQEFGRGGPHEIEFSGIRMSTLPSKSQGALYDLNFFLVEREVGWRLSLEYKSNLYTHDTALSLLDHFVEILRAFVTGPAQPLSGLALTQSGPLLRRLASTAETAAAATPQGGQHEAGVELQAMPASPAQERFWTLSQVDPSNAGFHIPVTVGVMGQLSPTLLEKSFQQLVDRHETLRTTFSEIDGSLMQVIHPGYKFSLETAAIAGVDKDERAKHLNALICAEVERPYDLASLPLFRGLLCRLSSDENVLVLTIHHCIADAASVQVFQRELWAAYEGLSSGSVVAAAPLELQYGDFSVWQRENLNSDLVKANLDYWLKLLSGDLPILNFPTDRPPSYNVASHGAIETQLLPEELARGLKQLAQSSDVTLFVLALAAFALVLGRASCAEDLIVGSPVVNRRMETETLIGPFAGPVALRLNLSGNPTLREFVLSVRNATFEALSHVELPFEVLLEKLKIKPSGGRKPLFQFYFFCQPAFLQSHRLPGLEVTPLPTTSLGIPFELQLGVIERAEGIRAELEYNSGLFDKATIREWLGYYQMILTRLVSNPDLKIGALPAPPFMASPAHLEMPGNGGPQGSQELRLNRDRAQPHVGGHEKLEADLVAIWAGVLKIQVMDVDDNFFAVGGRSLDAARLMTRINKKYSVTLGLATLFKYPTIRQFAQLVRGETAVPAPSSVVAIQPEGNAAPLFVVHGVGGNVLNFYDLARELGVNQPVYGIEAQALQVADAPITAFEELAAYYVREVKQVQAFGPYHFLGYSYGGLVAFEMARQLQAAGERVALLGMLDTPIWRHDNNPRYGTMARMGRQLRAIWSPFFQRLRPLTPPEIFDGVKSTLLRAFYTVAISQGRQIPASLRSVYHINSYAAVNYVPQEYKGKVTMLRASRERGPRDLGWGKFTTELVDVYEIPGAHLEVLSDKNMPAVIRVLKDHLRNE